MVTVGALDQLFDSGSNVLISCVLGLPWVLQECSEEESFVGCKKASTTAKFCVCLGAVLLVCEALPLFVQRVVHHPVFVGSVWLFLFWRLLRLWRHEKVRAHV